MPCPRRLIDVLSALHHYSGGTFVCKKTPVYSGPGSSGYKSCTLQASVSGGAKLYNPDAMQKFGHEHAPGLFNELLLLVVRNDKKEKSQSGDGFKSKAPSCCNVTSVLLLQKSSKLVKASKLL